MNDKTRGTEHPHEQDLDSLREIAALAIDSARQQGASASEVALGRSAGLDVNVRLGEVETIEHTRDNSLGVTVYFGNSKGSASSTDFRAPAVRETVEAACRIARHTAQDEFAGLADPERMAVDPPDLDLFHPWAITTEEAIALALEAETAARDHDTRITNSDGASVSRHDGDYVYGNSHGFLEGYSSSRNSLSCVVIAEDSSGMQRDYWYSSARDPALLEPASQIGLTAARRTIRRLGARKLETRNAPVLYEADIARGVIGHFVSAIRGGNLYRKASFLVDRLGDRIMAEHVRIHEQPHLRGALASAAFDGEGVATAPRELITAGVLQGYVLDSYSARKLGVSTTGNSGGIHNLTVEAGPKSFETLLAEMDTGLLVTELMGMGINIVTGDYSRGAAGFWVEGGEIAYPVEEITIAGNLADMFLGIREVGADVDARGAIRTGSLLVEQMTIAGN
ncbi:MAG: metalloprotease PmbA [Thiotrichales bacterium]|nr:metalloprotease PmbA [Thiotrichales bacterium]